MRQTEKGRKKKFQSGIPFILGPYKKISKKIEKKIKKLKNLFPELFLAKTGVDRPKKREKKTFAPISVHTRPGEENSEKNFSPEFCSYPTRARKFQKKQKKKIKKLKNLIPALFLSNKGRERPRKRKKNIYICPKFRSYSNRAKKFGKKLKKKSKKLKNLFLALVLAKTG